MPFTGNFLNISRMLAVFVESSIWAILPPYFIIKKHSEILGENHSTQQSNFYLPFPDGMMHFLVSILLLFFMNFLAFRTE